MKVTIDKVKSRMSNLKNLLVSIYKHYIHMLKVDQ
ncbi:hypothetical protein HDC91_001343 [Mucilaginibacter sp. AK015]|nr:hypothetical protein [Mucilaginibacter sp. AK015]